MGFFTAFFGLLAFLAGTAYLANLASFLKLWASLQPFWDFWPSCLLLAGTALLANLAAFLKSLSFFLCSLFGLLVFYAADFLATVKEQMTRIDASILLKLQSQMNMTRLVHEEIIIKYFDKRREW